MDKSTAELLKGMADKLDVPVEKLWEGLVAYAPFEYYQWLTEIVVCVSFLALFTLTFSIGIHLAKKDNDFAPIAITSFFGMVVVMIMLLMSGIGGVASALAAKNAPEAWAAKYIVHRIVKR